MTLPYNITDLTALKMYIWSAMCENLKTLINEFGYNNELDLKEIDPDLNIMVINPTTCEAEHFYVDKVTYEENRIRFYDGIDWMDAAEFPDCDFSYLHNEIIHYFQSLNEVVEEPIVVNVLFGEAAIRLYEEYQDTENELHDKYNSFSDALDGEGEMYLYRHIEFKTEAERLAYLQGIEDMNGWFAVELCDNDLKLD